MKRKLFVASVVALAAVVSVLAGESATHKAPELTYNLPGQGQKSLAQYHGKVVALEFILTTCPHCQDASKIMTRLQQEYGSRGFQALDLAINGLDEGRNPAQADQLVSAFSRNFQVGFPVGWVPRDSMLSFMGFSLMDRMVVPQMILIDRNGIVHYQTPALGDVSALQESTIRQRVEELLALNGPGAVSAKTHTVSAKKHS